MCILISAGKGSCSDDEYIIIITIIVAIIIIIICIISFTKLLHGIVYW